MKWLQSDGKLSNGMMTVKGSVSDLVKRGAALHWPGPLAFSLPLRGDANCNSNGSLNKLSYIFNLPPVNTSGCDDHGKAHCLFFFYWMRVKSAGALGSGCAHHVPASPCAGFTRSLLLLVYVKEMRSCEQCDRLMSLLTKWIKNPISVVVNCIYSCVTCFFVDELLTLIGKSVGGEWVGLGQELGFTDSELQEISDRQWVF